MSGIIRYDQVDISYNGRRVVQDVSFDLKAGEILGIAGESGSGKSTLLKAAMGLLGKDGLVTRGDIWYQDKNLPDLSERDMRPPLRTGDRHDFSDCRDFFYPHSNDTGANPRNDGRSRLYR